MPARTFPNIGLEAGFTPGENGWGDEMTRNMLLLSVLAQGTFLEKVGALPGVPANGDIYILNEVAVTNANKVAIRDEGAWVYVTPHEGWLLFNQGAGYFEQFDGAVWAEFETGGGGTTGPAPVLAFAGTAYNLLAADQGKYLRFTNATAKTLTVRPDATEALPGDGEWHVRNAAASNITVTPGAGVTINAPAGGSLLIPQNGTATLKRVALDVFDLLGVTVSA